MLMNWLVQRNALLLRVVLRYPAHGGHETERKLAHSNFLLTYRHRLYFLFRTLLNSSAGVNTLILITNSAFFSLSLKKLYSVVEKETLQ